ncbi:MAG: roadblock/LC7 domain-containing protein [Acidithiobacillales bacterium]
MALFGETPAPLSRLEELKRILQRDPTSRQFLALAEEYRRHGKMRDAIITLERGLSIHTSSVAAHVALGKAYQQLDRWEDAIRSYQNALRNDRENLVAIRQIAEVYLSVGEKLEALKKLKLYRGLKPGDRDVQEMIERLERELETPPPGRFPPEFRPLAEGAKARGTPMPYASPFGEAALPESAAPFDVSAEPGWPVPEWERRTEPVRSAFPEPLRVEPKPATVPWAAPGEVFPSGQAAAAGEAEAGVPTRVPSAEAAVFLETEPLAAPEEAAGSWLTESPTVPVVSEPEQLPEPAPKAPPPPVSLDSGVRRGRAFRERFEPPQPIEMTSEEPSDVPVEPSLPPAAAMQEVGEAPVPEGEVPEASATVGAAEEDRSEAPTGPLVTETLAELYRSQGYLVEAREVYLALAASATDPEASRAYARRAEALRASRQNAVVRKRLEGLLIPFQPPAPVATEDLAALLRSLVAEIPGVRTAILTDREGLPVVTEGLRENGETQEVLIAELTSFVKRVGRSGAEIGGGPLRSLAVVGEKGAAILANVTSDYALVIEAEPEAALGEVRWAAARAAERLRPAVG